MSEPEAQVPAEIQDSPHFATLRREKEAVAADLAAAKAQNGQLRALLASNAVELAGFTPNAEGVFEGPVALLVEKFQSSIADDVLPTKDDFLTLAGQYGVAPTPVAPDTPAGDEPSLADQIAAMQQGPAALQQMGQPPAPASDIKTRMDAALESGDVQTLLALQTQALSAPQSAA